MIKIYSGNDSYCLTNYINSELERQDGGFKTFKFEVSPHEPLYKYISEEVIIEFDNTYFTIKKIDRYANSSKIECDLCIDDFLQSAFFSYDYVEKTLAQHLTNILPTGWTAVGADALNISRTVHFDNECNTWDIICELQSLFDVKFAFDNKNKILTVIKYKERASKGIYFTDELNLTELSFKGDSSSFCTKLICRGKELDGGGFVTFASINDGKDYIENHAYSDKIISKVWQDDRYTDANSLLTAATAQLAEMAIPNHSYECKVIDLSKVNPIYKDLSYELYDYVTLIDRVSKKRIEHRIVNIVEHPQKHCEDTATLATATGKIETNIKKIESALSSPQSVKVHGKSLNEIKRDGTSNTASISEINSTVATMQTNIANVTETAQGLTATVTSISNDLGVVSENVTSIEQTAEKLQVNIQTGAAQNLILNSVGYNSFKGWSYTNVNNIMGLIEDTNSKAGKGFKIASRGGLIEIYQSIKLESPYGKYSYSFVIYDNGSHPTPNIYLKYSDGTTKTLFNSATTDTPQLIHGQFETVNKSATLYITTSSFYFFTLTDLIITATDFICDWQLGKGEYGNISAITDNTGLTIGSSSTPCKTKISPEDLEISKNGDKAIYFSGERSHLNKTEIDGDVRIGNISIVNVGTSTGIDLI